MATQLRKCECGHEYSIKRIRCPRCKVYPPETPKILRGFKPLIDGRIHLLCDQCGRKMSNGPRANYDPPNAVLIVVPCDCTQGCKIEGGDYYDAAGNGIGPLVAFQAEHWSERLNE